MNHLVGKWGAGITGLSVVAFAISMLFGPGAIFASCLSSLFIALGYLPFAAGVVAVNVDVGRKATGIAALSFGAVYAVLILLVYYAQCTTVRMHPDLSEEALSLISYGHLGSLFFNYNLLGYGMMALSTFLLGFLIVPADRSSRRLRMLLWGHGIFFFPCLIVPMLPVFTTATNALVGTIVLECWCFYFLPICLLGFRYFTTQHK